MKKLDLIYIAIFETLRIFVVINTFISINKDMFVTAMWMLLYFCFTLVIEFLKTKQS